MRRNLAHSSAFFLVAGSKTIYNIGQACLTVDAAVKAVYCLTRYYDKPGDINKNVAVFNIALQVLAASVSTIVMAWSRYQFIWKNLKIEEIKNKHNRFKHALDSNLVHTVLFSIFAIFGVLSCIARGFSAYLGAEVIFRERFKIGSVGVDIVSGFVGVTAMIASLCFNLSNMLKAGVEYLKEPKIKLSFRYVFGFLAVLTQAIVTRFFIKEFLDRRGANEAVQIIAQSVFFTARFTMDSFTLGSSLEEGWWNRSKTTLQRSSMFSFFMISDAISTWLGYSAIVLYSILTDIFITKSASNNRILCSLDQTHKNFILHCFFIGVSLVVGIPSVIASFNYLLSKDVKKGYDSTVRFFKSPSASCRKTFSDEEQALLNPNTENSIS